MQALFYIGLFGTFFFVMTGITAGVARTTFQAQLDREDRVEEIFTDIEYTINRIVLRDSLTLPADNDNDLDYALPHLSWSSEDVMVDPWARPIEAVRLDEEQVVAAFGAGEAAIANISHYALISGGPNRRIDTDLPETIEDWRTLHSVGGVEDDIVRTFSTREPMMETWNAAAEIEKTVADMVTRSYRQRVEKYENYVPDNAPAGTEPTRNITLFTNCALLNQTGNVDGYDCTGFSTQLIYECHRMHEYNMAMRDYDPTATPTGGGQTPGVVNQMPNRPSTEILPREGDVEVGQCWRYEASLKNDVNFPTMAGDPSGGARTCAGENDCDVDASQLGVRTELLRDPFGGMRLVYDDDNPDQLRIVRNGTFGGNNGWRIVRNNIVKAD